eukprot:6608269-Lingulodinium_polyedra.AAC.1
MDNKACFPSGRKDFYYYQYRRDMLARAEGGPQLGALLGNAQSNASVPPGGRERPLVQQPNQSSFGGESALG